MADERHELARVLVSQRACARHAIEDGEDGDDGQHERRHDPKTIEMPTIVRIARSTTAHLANEYGTGRARLLRAHSKSSGRHVAAARSRPGRPRDTPVCYRRCKRRGVSCGCGPVAYGSCNLPRCLMWPRDAPRAAEDRAAAAAEPNVGRAWN